MSEDSGNQESVEALTSRVNELVVASVQDSARPGQDLDKRIRALKKKVCLFDLTFPMLGIIHIVQSSFSLPTLVNNISFSLLAIISVHLFSTNKMNIYILYYSL